MKASTIIALFTAVRAADVVVNWKVQYVEGANPDGQFPRRVIGVNGKWPLPPLEANLGDTLIINVENGLDVPTALHTHGLFHNNTNFYDGAYGVTECGIAPGSKFTYSIPIQQTGTYWAHGHYNGQYVDGFQTSLILRGPNEKTTLKYDDEYVLAFTDWYHEQHSVLLKQFLGIFNPNGAEPIPDSAIINHGEKTELKFVPGKTYRLRLISMTAIGRFNFYLDGHKFKIIEVDGELVEPYETDVLFLAAAQRYSVLVTAKSDAKYNYYAHGKFDQDMLDSPSPNPNASIPIIYNASAPFFIEKDKSEYPEGSNYAEFTDTVLKPLVPESVEVPSQSIVLDVDFVQYEDALNHGTFNRTIFQLPPVAPMFTAMTMGEKAMNPKVYGPRTLPVVLKHMEMVEVVINNRDPGHHPFHLHGHKFQIVQVGSGVYDPAVHAAESQKAENPVRRDTIVLPAEGFAVIRFRADNPGVWLMHCHIEWHLQAGLANIFIEAPDVMQKRMKIPQNVLDQCSNQKLKTSGNAAGFNDDVTFTGIDPPPSLYPTYMQAKGVISLIACIISALIGLGAVLWYSSFDNPANKVEPSQ